MPPFDREGALKSAEKALSRAASMRPLPSTSRSSRPSPATGTAPTRSAISTYAPNQLDKGLEQFTRIADHLAAEGFYPKAAALFKKILKLKPDDEYALLQSGDLAAQQGTLADAKQYFQTVADRRKARGDHKGAAEIAIRLGTLDPDDLEARLRAAQLAAEIGDATTALREFRDVAARYEKQDRGAEARPLQAAFDLDQRRGTRTRLFDAYLSATRPTWRARSPAARPN